MIENESMWTPDGQLKEITTSAPLFPEQAQVEEPEESEELEEQPDVEETPVPTPAPKKGSYDDNIANLRKKAEDLENRLRKKEEEAAALIAQQQQYQQQYYQPVPQYAQPADDDLVEGRHFNALQKEIAELKAQQQQTQYQNYAQSVDQQLKLRHADFDEVVTEANLIKLRDQQPEVFQSIYDTKDIFAKGVTAYAMLQSFGIVPKNDNNLARIKANRNKPQASNSVAPQQSNSPLSKANPFTEGLTPEGRKALLKEMDDAISRL